jgi:Gluconate 2-dehydrogenase subunit 3
MNRRETLKQLLMASGGLIALPSWAMDWTIQDLAAYESNFSAAEQQVIASLADTIIPAGNSIGALSVGVEKFLQKLIENCYGKEVQDNVKEQLAALETAAQRVYGKSFIACDQSQRQELLLKLSTSENKNEKDFFNLMKSETIRGFNTSKEVMTRYLNYKVAPGHYHGCVDVKA